jgi:hypothetical protein
MNVNLPQNERRAARAPMEHRWGMRIELHCPVILGDGDAAVAAGRLINASISGALIGTEAKLPALTPITVTIQTGGSADRCLTLSACVVRTEPGAIGVEWRDMAAQPLVDLLHEVQREAQLWARDTAFD